MSRNFKQSNAPSWRHYKNLEKQKKKKTPQKRGEKKKEQTNKNKHPPPIKQKNNNKKLHKQHPFKKKTPLIFLFSHYYTQNLVDIVGSGQNCDKIQKKNKSYGHDLFSER